MLEDGDIPSSNVGINRGNRPPSTHSYPPTDENRTPRPSHDHGKRSKTPSLRKHNAFANESDVDAASTIARSTFSDYAPSSQLEQRRLLSSGRNPLLHHRPQPQRTKGRKTFLGICNAVNVVIPIDVNEEATSMRGSSLAKLARTVNKKEEPLSQGHETETARLGSV